MGNTVGDPPPNLRGFFSFSIPLYSKTQVAVTPGLTHRLTLTPFNGAFVEHVLSS